MARSSRLLELLQLLRRRRRPVPAARLAEELGVSLRTVYRDVATLVQQGAPIEGEAGLGYVMRPGFFLPPLSFDEDELDALVLGLGLVSRRGDADLERAAANALAKIVAVLPPAGEILAQGGGLLAGPVPRRPGVTAIRRAMRDERKLRLTYTDGRGVGTERVVWPVALGFFEAFEMLAAWCEMRGEFRHFRLDRIVAASRLDESLPKRRRVLLAEWRLLEIERGSVCAADTN